jgi:hypothetical protein
MKRGPKKLTDYQFKAPIHNEFYWVKRHILSNFEIAKFIHDKFYFTGEEMGYYPSVVEKYEDLPIRFRDERWDSRFN